MGLAKTKHLPRPQRVGGFPPLVHLRPAPPLPTLATGLEGKGSGAPRAGTPVGKKTAHRVERRGYRVWEERGGCAGQELGKLAPASAATWVLVAPDAWYL